MDFAGLFKTGVSSEDDDTPVVGVHDPDAMGEGETWCENGQHFYHRESTRGRVPKSCPEHRPSPQKASSGSVKPAGKPGSAGYLADLEHRLALLVAQAGLGFAASPLRTTGAVLTADASEWASATLELCKNNERALAVIDNLTKALPATKLAQLGARAVVAAGTDMGRIPPDHMLAEMLNVRQVWEKLNGPYVPKVWEAPAQPPQFQPIGA